MYNWTGQFLTAFSILLSFISVKSILIKEQLALHKSIDMRITNMKSKLHIYSTYTFYFYGEIIKLILNLLKIQANSNREYRLLF